jgi:hypothetical protein
VVALQVFGGRFDRDGRGFAGHQRNVVVGVKNRQDALAALLLMKLQVREQGDVGTVVVQRYGKERVGAVNA